MAQTIALQARAPQVSLADVMDQVQRTRMNELKIEDMQRSGELDAVTKGQQIDEANALGRYRQKMGAQDPNALKELNAYPEHQKKLFDAFEAMSPQEYMEAAKKAQAFGQAARRVASFAEGTPQQKQAWDKELDGLTEMGYIDADDAEEWKAQGPSAEIINEALSVSDYVAKQYKGKHSALDEARINEINARVKRQDELKDARIGDIDTDNTRAQQGTDGLNAYRQAETTRKKAKDEWGIEDDKADNDRDTANLQADNNRADRDLARKIEEGKAKGKKTSGPNGGEANSGLGENEYGRRIRDIQNIIEKRRSDDTLNDDEVLALERELRKKYRIPVTEPPISGLDPAGGTGTGAGGKKDMFTDPKAKPPSMKDRVIGKVYATPKGPMEWTGTGWVPAENG